MDELLQVWALCQMGRDAKPLGVLDVNGFFVPQLAYLDRLVGDHFLRSASRAMLVVDDDAERLLGRMAGVRG